MIALAVLAGIVAKGLGAIAIIFLVGVAVGVLISVTIASKLRGRRPAGARRRR